MPADIRQEGMRNLEAVQRTNRGLLERALQMRAASYLAQQKARLLTQTIFEIDRSKQELRDHSRALEQGQATILHQKAELEARTSALEEIQRSLEERVQRRTQDLELANRALREEAAARARMQVEREQLNEKYLRAQKLELVGRLAGGVAHDFNNLLTVILGHGELARRKVGPGSVAEDLDGILEACRRGAALTRQLLSFAGKRLSSTAVTEPGEVVRDLARLLSGVLGPVSLELDVADEVGNVRVHRSDLEQILLNLIVNARDAMPRGGRIAVSSLRVERPNDGPTPHGACVALTISDDGEGMSDEVLERVFEPFFTTKPPGVGTGLGLATVESIVRDCGGRIEVESQPGAGTTFRVFLPTVDSPSDPVARRPGPSALPQGHESVLVVDDDDDILVVLRGMLQTLGYRVFTADRADAALRVLDGERIDLLLVDSIMPDVTGEALEARVAKRWPAMRVLLMSGYADRPRPRDARGRSLPFVEKPLELANLAFTLRQVLERSD